MTDTAPDFGSGTPLGYPCPEDDCDYEAKTKLALGAHRHRAHGTPGAKAKRGASRSRGRTSSSSSRPATPAPAADTATLEEIRSQIEDLADKVSDRAPRTAASLRNRSKKIAGAGRALWARTEVGERMISAAGDEDKALLMRLGIEVAPVALTAFTELIAPRVFEPLIAMWERRRRRVVADGAGNQFLVDRRGNIFTMDGTPTGQNIHDVPAGPEPAPHAEPTPAPVDGLGLVDLVDPVDASSAY